MNWPSYWRHLPVTGLVLVIGLLSGCGAAATAIPTAGPTATAVEVEPTEAPTVAEVETQPQGEEAPEFASRRARMVEQGIIGWGIDDQVVIEAIGRVPRHAFVPEQYVSQAYQNHPLPIGYGQTISQPYIVALMTQEAGVKPGDKVLEIGTGSGYQAAVLAELVDQVHSMEIIGPLAKNAKAVLDRLGYENIAIRHADGYFGWPEQAPFDAIVVTAAPDHIPQPLIEQLRPGGRMVIPVGPVGGYQTLWLVAKTEEGEVQTRDLGGVSFVPLTREER